VRTPWRKRFKLSTITARIPLAYHFAQRIITRLVPPRWINHHRHNKEVPSSRLVVIGKQSFPTSVPNRSLRVSRDLIR